MSAAQGTIGAHRSVREAVIAARTAQKMGCTKLADILLAGIPPFHAFAQAVVIDRAAKTIQAARNRAELLAMSA